MTPDQNVMTSPYLNRPARSLSEALRARADSSRYRHIAKEPHRQKSEAIQVNETSFMGHSYIRALLVGIFLISVISMAVMFIDRESLGKTALGMEAKAEHMENSITPVAPQH
jgi:hypothetical protein